MKFKQHLEESKKRRGTTIDLSSVTSAKKADALKLAKKAVLLHYGGQSSSFSQLNKNRKLLPGVYKKLRELGVDITEIVGSDLLYVMDNNKEITKELRR